MNKYKFHKFHHAGVTDLEVITKEAYSESKKFNSPVVIHKHRYNENYSISCDLSDDLHQIIGKK